jgi:hypothetical protein
MIVRPYLCLVRFPRVQITALKSTVHSWSRTPPSGLPLTGGGGSDAADTFRADLDGSRKGALINGPQWIPDPPPPPAVLSLMGGGGGSGIDYKPRANLDGSQSDAQINGPQWIPDPPLHPTFNGRGGVRNQE